MRGNQIAWKTAVLLLTGIGCLSFFLCGCQEKQEKQESGIETSEAAETTTWKGDSLADSESETASAPQGMEVITDPAKFQAVTEDQTYQFETDEQNCFVDGGLPRAAKDEYCYYFLNYGYLSVFDTRTKQYTLLCNKPECRHGQNEGCNAQIAGAEGIFYYKGSLYTILTEMELPEQAKDPNDFSGGVYQSFSLYRISTDGTQREKLCELSRMLHMVNGGEDGNMGITAVLHRGYLYYAYLLQTGDDQYQNGSNVLWRIPIDGSREKECIMPFPAHAEIASMRMLSAGSYVYFMPADQMAEGELYRFQTEAKQVEKLPLPKLYVKDFALMDQQVLYKENTEKAILKVYDPKTGTDRIWADMTDEQRKEAWAIAYDQGYAYVFHFDEESGDNPDKYWMQITPDGTCRMEITTKEVKKELLKTNENMTGTGPCDGYFFAMPLSGRQLYYLELDAVKNGKPEFVKAGD